MRKFAFILTVAALGVITSCSSLLDVEPSNNLSGDIYTNEENIQSALTGAYFNLGGYFDGGDGGELFGGDFMIIPSLLTRENVFGGIVWDDVNGASYSDFADKDIQATNPRVEANWVRAYEVINTLNSILENIDNVENTSSRSRIRGEALAMRAILYFEMVRLWAPEYQVGINESELAVPLLLESVEEPGPSPDRNTIGEIYTKVKADLTTASGLLESLGANGIWLSYYACEAYLMRIAMHENDGPQAIIHAENIIDDNTYSLAGNPASAFNNTANSTEDIFAIQQTTNGNAGNTTSGTGATNFYSSLTNQGIGAFRIGQSYLNDIFGDFRYSPEFDSVDMRWGIDSLTAENSVADINSGFYVNILNNATLSPSKYAAFDRVIPVLRYAEVLLTRAEALAVQSPTMIDATALSDYNMIRTRAGLSELQSSDFTEAVPGIQLYDSILVERRREFFLEGQLLHDLRRIGNQTLDGVSLSDTRFILPIPQAETDAGSGN